MDGVDRDQQAKAAVKARWMIPLRVLVKVGTEETAARTRMVKLVVLDLAEREICSTRMLETETAMEGTKGGSGRMPEAAQRERPARTLTRTVCTVSLELFRVVLTRQSRHPT